MNPQAPAPSEPAAASAQAEPNDTVPPWVQRQLPTLALRDAPGQTNALQPAASVYDVVITTSEVLAAGKAISTASVADSGEVQPLEELALELRKLREAQGEAAPPPPVRFWVDRRVSARVFESAIRAAEREKFFHGELVFAGEQELRQRAFFCRASEVPGRIRFVDPGLRLPPEVIQRVIRENFDDLRACYEEGLGRDPKLTGKVAVRFVIGRDGKVSHAGPGDVKEGALNDERVVECVLGEFRKFEFPPPREGIITVTYPIEFSREEDSSGGTAPAAAPAAPPSTPSVHP